MSGNDQPKYFDLHLRGLAYLRRVRKVEPKQGQPYIACDLIAFHGEVGKTESVRLDAKVVGNGALEDIGYLKAAANDRDQTVVVGFRCGDLSPTTFTHQSGEREGQTGIALKTRLLKLFHASVKDSAGNRQRVELPSQQQANDDDASAGSDAATGGDASDEAQPGLAAAGGNDFGGVSAGVTYTFN